MCLGLSRPNRQRAVRAVAGFVAAFLLSGNVLAAAGMCAVKAPAEARVAVAPVAADGSESLDCSHHLIDEGVARPAGSTHHCPTEDPSAQPRTVDLPGAQWMAALAAVVLDWSSDARQPSASLAADERSEPRPLYARLQRLRL
jgi:hypothetical protein